MRPDCVAEQRRVPAFLQPVGAAVLLVCPACGQVIDVRKLIVNDRPVTHRRPDNGVLARCQRLEQPTEIGSRYDGMALRVHIADMFIASVGTGGEIRPILAKASRFLVKKRGALAKFRHTGKLLGGAH